MAVLENEAASSRDSRNDRRQLMSLLRPREGESAEEFSKRFSASIAEALKDAGEGGADPASSHDEGTK